MSDVESGPGMVPEGHECPEGQMPDPDNPGQCIPVAEVQPDIDATGAVTTSEVTASKGKVKPIGLTQRFQRSVEEYFNQMEGRFKAWMKAEFKRLQLESEKEAEEALRKSWGLEKDPVIRRSDLAKLARSLKLEGTQPSKRLMKSTDKGVGPSGNADENKSEQSKNIESLMKSYGVKQ